MSFFLYVSRAFSTSSESSDPSLLIPQDGKRPEVFCFHTSVGVLKEPRHKHTPKGTQEFGHRMRHLELAVTNVTAALE